MEPLFTGMVVIGGLCLVISVGVGAVRARRAWALKPKPAPDDPLRDLSKASEVIANPDAIKPGDTVSLTAFADSYIVHAVARYQDDEEPDDYWYEFELYDTVEGKTTYLSADLDEEDRWVWSHHERLSESEIEKIEAIASASFKGSKPTKKPFMARGMQWTLQPDCRHYLVRVTDRRIDRPETKSYTARVTDYEDGDGREFSVELWKGGRCVTLGRPLPGRVLV